MNRAANLIITAVIALASFGAAHYLVFWGGFWQFAPRLWWLTVPICGLLLFLLLGLWYVLGRTRGPLLAACGTLVAIDAVAIALAGGLDLSRLSLSQGFTLEIAVLALPAGAYFATLGVSLLVRRRDQAGT